MEDKRSLTINYINKENFMNIEAILKQTYFKAVEEYT